MAVAASDSSLINRDAGFLFSLSVSKLFLLIKFMAWYWYATGFCGVWDEIGPSTASL